MGLVSVMYAFHGPRFSWPISLIVQMQSKVRFIWNKINYNLQNILLICNRLHNTNAMRNICLHINTDTYITTVQGSQKVDQVKNKRKKYTAEIEVNAYRYRIDADTYTQKYSTYTRRYVCDFSSVSVHLACALKHSFLRGIFCKQQINNSDKPEPTNPKEQMYQKLFKTTEYYRTSLHKHIYVFLLLKRVSPTNPTSRSNYKIVLTTDS